MHFNGSSALVTHLLSSSAPDSPQLTLTGTWSAIFVAEVVYFVGIFVLRRLFPIDSKEQAKNRAPMGPLLKAIVALHNIALSVVSGAIVVGVVAASYDRWQVEQSSSFLFCESTSQTPSVRLFGDSL
jgi:Kef-type K+ transport system membrane component KefB